uniref:Uncharacterized protein n=1 Tax=Clytia hemisphaerica TaxID=252671 RepID=A0A7M5XKW6_9CNID
MPGKFIQTQKHKGSVGSAIYHRADQKCSIRINNNSYSSVVFVQCGTTSVLRTVSEPACVFKHTRQTTYFVNSAALIAYQSSTCPLSTTNSTNKNYVHILTSTF